jgi:hypothetical protein
MVLENLDRLDVSVDTLGLTIEGNSRRTAKEKYETLKKSRLYDSNTKLWLSHVLEGDDVEEVAESEAQLFGVWLEDIFYGRSKAGNLYTHLTNSNLYKSESFWKDSISINGSERQEFGLTVPSRLLSLLVEERIFLDSVRSRFSDFRNSGAFDEDTGFWSRSGNYARVDMHRVFRPGDTQDTASQLYNILAEVYIIKDPDLATEVFDWLKNETDLYKSDKFPHWVNAKSKSGPSLDPRIFTCNQLLGILVEAQFDKEKAKREYERLKNTPLYNRDTKLWEESMGVAIKDPIFEGKDIIRSTDQLLALLVEETLGIEDKVLGGDSVELPLERNY